MSALLSGMFALALASVPAVTEIEAAGPLGPLKGTLTYAGAGAPVVLIIPGSGPTDRDGNNPLGFKPGTYRLLAEGLAARGIGSVRIDKRGMFGSAKAAADANDVTISDYAADTRSWIKTITGLTGARCVWLLGHSEGGLVALAAAQEPADICGLILTAAAGRPLGAILREQLRANPANAPLLDQALAAVDRLEAGQPVDTTGFHPALLQLFAPPVQKAMIDMLSHDPAALIGRYRGPILILQGDKDIQVTLTDAQKLKAARPDAKLVVIPGVTHVLKRVASDDRAANIATYTDPALPLASEVVEAVAEFVKPRRSGR